MKNQIKAVFFDAGRVLVEIDFDKFGENLKPFTKIPVERILENVDYGAFLVNQHTKKYSGNELFQDACKTFRLKGIAQDQFIKFWEDIIVKENEDIYDVLENMNKRTDRVLLSDIGFIHWRYLKKFKLIKKYFSRKDQQVLSYKVGTMKPSPIIFKEALRRYQLEPREVVFIDDTEKNTEGFRKMGGNAINYDCRYRSIDWLISELKKFNLIK